MMIQLRAVSYWNRQQLPGELRYIYKGVYHNIVVFTTDNGVHQRGRVPDGSLSGI